MLIMQGWYTDSYVLAHQFSDLGHQKRLLIRELSNADLKRGIDKAVAACVAR